MSVKYSKKRLVSQQTGNKNLKYMAPLEAGTVLTITDLVENEFDGDDGQKVMNDVIMCVNDKNGETIKVPVREYNKMTLEGDKFEGSDDGDAISLPNQIIISKSEPRMYTPEGGKEQEMFPIFSYNDVQKFLDPKDKETTYDALINSGRKDGDTNQPVQNYFGKVN